MMSAAGAGGGLNVEDVFSTYLYTGTSSNRNITNNIDLDGEGGLVWTKQRNQTEDNWLVDTERGVNIGLKTNSTQGSDTGYANVTSFNTDGYSLGVQDVTNESPGDFASWTFRKAPKFFDVVTYTGTGANQTISHNLGSTPGMIIVKAYSGTGGWIVYHRSNGATKFMYLNGTGAVETSSLAWNNTAPTATEFTVGTLGGVSGVGKNYIAYLFAHNDDDGEFGPDGDADIIKCGSYTGGTSGIEIDLGFEPQWLLIKSVDSANSWFCVDNMRGFDGDNGSNSASTVLRPNSSGSENTASFHIAQLLPNGFTINSVNYESNASGEDYIYIAIRRGPMAVPESATDVFAMDTLGGTLPNPPAFNSGFTVDAGLYKVINSSSSWSLSSRLTQGKRLSTDSTAAEASESAQTFDFMDGYYNATSVSTNYQSWMWKRAPNYFDVVAYTGNGTAGRTVSHNLGVAPEMMWVKVRSQSYGWITYHESLGNTKYMTLDDTTAAATYSQNWNNTDPTATEFTLGTNWNVNKSGETFIAYLFASLDGVSKVGTFTHTDGTPTDVDCGFTSGARFVIWKKTSNIGQWVVVDTERGIVAGNDPYLELNSTNAESSAYDIIDPLSSGFTVGSVMSSGTYIFYAIA